MANEYFITVKDLQQQLDNMPDEAFIGVQLKRGVVVPMLGLGLGQSVGDLIVIILT